jgi:hypothetical protein
MLRVSSDLQETDMQRSQHTARDYALGAVVNTAALASYFGALVLWSRFCAAHKHRVS